MCAATLVKPNEWSNGMIVVCGIEGGTVWIWLLAHLVRAKQSVFSVRNARACVRAHFTDTLRQACDAALGALGASECL